MSAIIETVAAYFTGIATYDMNPTAKADVKFSRDDYDADFSTMSCMVETLSDFVKLDKGIVSCMRNKPSYIAMTSMVAMLKQLKLKIVAEGVETEEQANILSELGCDYLQGYYSARNFNPLLPALAAINLFQVDFPFRSEY